MLISNLLMATGALPALIGATGNVQSSSSSVSVTPHASARTGDLLVAILNAGSANAWNTTAGWTEHLDQAAVPGFGLQSFIHDGSGSYTFTKAGSSAPITAEIIVLRDAAIDVVGGFGTRASGSSSAFDAPSITVGATGRLLLCAQMADNTGALEGNCETPTGFTDVLYTGSTGPTLYSPIKSYVKTATAGATGAVTCRISTSSGNKAAALFSVKEV